MRKNILIGNILIRIDYQYFKVQGISKDTLGSVGVMNAVVVKDLVKYYGKFQALYGISFEVKEGEIFGLIGPNGAGKSTTLKILATLLKPSSGEVKIFGHDVVEEASEIRRIISYLPEEAGAYKNLTGYEYLRFMARIYGGNVQEMLERAIEIADLGPDLYNTIGTYSKGMTRKLLVARALMVMPKLSILDEPTSGLDVVNALRIRDIIKEYKKKGITFIVSSHNMLEVQYICDRVAIIHKGRIVECGGPEELLRKYNAENLEEVFVQVSGEKA